MIRLSCQRYVAVSILFLGLCLSAVADESDSARPQLEVLGVSAALETNIRRSVHPQRYRCLDEDWQLKRLQRKAVSGTDQALQALGYYQSEIQADIKRDPNCWTLSIRVQTGEQVILESVEIDIQGELADLPAMQHFLDDPPLRPGSGLNHAEYDKTKTGIVRLATRYGFFEGEFLSSRLDIDPVAGEATVKLIYRAGPRSRLGEIQMDQTLFDAELMAQYLILEPGGYFDSNDLLKQQQLLVSSGYFSSVKVVADHDILQPDGRIPVSIELDLIKQHAYSFGVGASTDTGPRISFGIQNRRLNQRGHQYGFDSQLSPKLREATFNYRVPKAKAGAERLEYQLGYKYENLETYDEESLKLAVLNTDTYDSGWVRTFFVEYLDENFVVASAPGDGKLLTPGVRYRKTTADAAIFPLRGWRTEVVLRAATEELISTTDLLQLTLTHKRIWPMPAGRLLARGKLGASLVSDFERLPASVRFFAGGDNSVRGFEYKTLGPLAENGEVLGGKHLITASLEYEYPIRSQWGLAAFIDSGNAFDEPDLLELQTGAGIGLRWYSPVGPIRLDLAQDITQENSPRLHLSMGLDL